MTYTVTVSMTADDYKRPVNSVSAFRAETLDDAMAIALNEYLDRVVEYPTRMKALARAPLAETVFATLHSAFGPFEIDEDADADAEEAAQEAHEKAQAEARMGLGRLIEPLFNWFQENEDTLFRGEYVPKDLAIVIEKDDVDCDPRPNLEDSFESLFAQLEDELPEAREEAASKGKKKRA